MATSGSDFVDWAADVWLKKLEVENPTPTITQAAPQPDNANAYVDKGSSPAAYAGTDAGRVNTGQTAVAENTVSVGGIIMDKRILTVTGVALAGMALVKLAKG